MSSDDLLVLWTCFDLGGCVLTHPVAGATVSSSNDSILDIGPVLTRQRRLSYDSTEHGMMEHGRRADLLAASRARVVPSSEPEARCQRMAGRSLVAGPRFAIRPPRGELATSLRDF